MGSGKTLSMVRQAYHYYLEGYKVLTNMALNFPHERITSKDVVQFAKHRKGLYNCVVLIDEIHIFLDSRRSASKKNLVGSYFITQTRKQKVKLLGTTQHRHQVDRRVRDNTDMFIDCEKQEVEIKDKHQETKKVLIITNHVHTRERYAKERFVGNKYFGLYDTEEIIFDDDVIE